MVRFHGPKKYIKTVSDPGFSLGGANSQNECAKLLFFHFLPKTA